MSDYDDDVYDEKLGRAQGQALLRRFERQLEKKQNLVEAMNRDIKNYLKTAAQNEEISEALYDEVVNARNSHNPSEYEKLKRFVEGGYNYQDNEVITGMEPRPWEED